jgi:hypothetical protein
MTDEKESVPERTWPRPTTEPAKKKVATKKKATKKAPSKPATYKVVEGKAITVRGRIAGPGDTITAADVADIEALLGRGYIVKA